MYCESSAASEVKRSSVDRGRKEGCCGVWHGSVVPVCFCTGICTGQHKGAFVLSETHTLTASLLTQQVWSWLFLCCVSPPLLLASWQTSTSPVPPFPRVLQMPLPSHLHIPCSPLFSSLTSLLAELFMAVHCAKWPVHCWYRRIHFIRALCVVVCVCADWICMGKWVVGIMEWGEAGYTGNRTKASERKGR